MVLEKTLESPLDCKEIKPVNPKGNQSWIFFRRTNAEAEIPILWTPDGKNWLIGKNPDGGKDWRQEEKRMKKDEMVGWHLWLKRDEFEHALGVGDGQVSLVCYSPWGLKESNTTEQLNWTLSNKSWIYLWDAYFMAFSGNLLSDRVFLKFMGEIQSSYFPEKPGLELLSLVY